MMGEGWGLYGGSQGTLDKKNENELLQDSQKALRDPELHLWYLTKVTRDLPRE